MDGRPSASEKIAHLLFDLLGLIATSVEVEDFRDSLEVFHHLVELLHIHPIQFVGRVIGRVLTDETAQTDGRLSLQIGLHEGVVDQQAFLVVGFGTSGEG